MPAFNCFFHGRCIVSCSFLFQFQPFFRYLSYFFNIFWLDIKITKINQKQTNLLLGSPNLLQTFVSQTLFLLPSPPYFGLSLQFMHSKHSSALQPLH